MTSVLRGEIKLPGRPLIWGAALTVCLLFVYSWLQKRSKRQRHVPGIPILGGKENLLENRQRFLGDSLAMLREGYEQVTDIRDRYTPVLADESTHPQWKGSFFYVPTPLGERLMIPGRYLEDLKSANMRHVDFQATFLEVSELCFHRVDGYLILSKMFEGHYTTLGTHTRLLPQVVRTKLNQYLVDVMPGIQEEIRDSFDQCFPLCDDWTEVNVVEMMALIVARVSSRMFGGSDLSQNEEWVQASLKFAHDGFTAAQKLKQWPDLLKPIAQYLIPEIRAIRSFYEIAERAAVPLMEDRERHGIKALDLLAWMADQAKGSEKDLKFIAGTLLKVSFAAYHTSAAAPTQLLFDLAAMPEYMEPLRAEIAETIGPDGNISAKGFAQMSKMDSIMKESQRFNPLLLITFERVVTKEYRLSDGFVIPANTWIGVPAQAIAMDATLHPEPEVFDGFRFAKTRAADTTAKPGYAASNAASMAFGYGQHACPGRFFAANEIKAIMAQLLLRYDFKYPEGVSRPPSLVFETQNLPNPAGRILFKRRPTKIG
ncbi:MAG: hypothetical protein M1837_002682 [Sclerophora amabilis]|nr:MAG: hypothetical protein M1837_002682 [Sclerophora amabilis]